MTRKSRGLALAALQLLLALAVFGRLQLDRIIQPRVWARTVPIDPVDPLRGRYLRLWLEAEDRRASPEANVVFAVENDRLVVRDAPAAAGIRLRELPPADSGKVVPDKPVAFFLPESAADPSQLGPGQELWVEVTVPPHGLPRPIRLEVRSAGGQAPPAPDS